jgi:hypothetical protein
MTQNYGAKVDDHACQLPNMRRKLTMNHGFLTPEEAMIRKQRKKVLFYVALPLIPIAVGLLVTVLLNSL